MVRRSGRLLDDAQDVALLHDQEIFAVDLHFRAGPLAEQDAVALLDVEGLDLAAVVAGAGADGDDFAFLRLFLGGVGVIIPPLVFCSSSTRFTRTRSPRGRNAMMCSPLGIGCDSRALRRGRAFSSRSP